MQKKLSKKQQKRTTAKRVAGPMVLAILDGWGIAPKGPGNAVVAARTPFFDKARRRYPTTELQAHGRYVGLLPDQEGNSEAGHMNIGAGRLVRQEIVTVTEAIKDGTFFKNAAFKEPLRHVRERGATVHIVGLMSNGNSAHACPEHLFALLQLMEEEKVERVRLHLFTDGRDSAPFSATRFLHEVEKHLRPGQHIASIMGRFYAMDRNKLWQRTELAYNCIVNGEGLVAPSAHAAILTSYNRGESDEFMLPTVIVGEDHIPTGTVADGDAIIFFNLRSDRARQLTKTFVQDDFEQRNKNSFTRKRIVKNVLFTAMTEFGSDLSNVLTAFPSSEIVNGLTETLTLRKQLYIAESEKYAHVTYFFNGGYLGARYGEERVLVPSLALAHHDLQPKMRALAITKEVVRRIKGGVNDFICLNFANADMVGHTGNIKATVAAVECIDACLARIAKVVLAAGGCLVVTGDHGNAERKIHDATGEIVTEHSANPVPFLLVSEKLCHRRIGDGMLSDVAPTILDIMGVPKPQEMTGFSLLR